MDHPTETPGAAARAPRVVGRFSDAALAVGLTLLAVGVWLAGKGLAAPVNNPDSHDFADIGREIHRGHGFAARQLFPRHIPFMKERGLLDREHWPLLHRYPLTPLLIASTMTVVADAATAAVVQSGLFFVACVPMAYLLARRFVHPLIACIPALLVLGDPGLVHVRIAGHAPALALILGVFLVVQRGGDRWWSWLAAGALCGTAYLARSPLLVLLVAPALYALRCRRIRARVRALALVAAGTLAVTSPWLIRTLVLTGNPFFSFSNTRNLVRNPALGSDVELELNEPVQASALLRKHGDEIRSRVTQNLLSLATPGFWWRMFDHGAIVFLLLSLAGLFAGPRQNREEWKALVRCTCLFLALSTILTALAIHRVEYYLIYRPLLVTVGWVALAGGLAPMWNGQPWRSVCVALVCAAVGAALWLTARSISMQRRMVEVATAVESGEQSAMAVVGRLVPAEAVLVSDVAGQVAFYAERRAIRAPIDPGQIETIHDSYVKVNYLLLSPRARGQGESWETHRLYDRYAEFIESQAFERRYRLVAELPNGDVLYARRDER